MKRNFAAFLTVESLLHRRSISPRGHRHSNQSEALDIFWFIHKTPRSSDKLIWKVGEYLVHIPLKSDDGASSVGFLSRFSAVSINFFIFIFICWVFSQGGEMDGWMDGGEILARGFSRQFCAGVKEIGSDGFSLCVLVI